MKFLFSTLLLALLYAFVSAVAQTKTIIVTYPDNTPDHVLQAAKDEIIKAGGSITHEYRHWNGFSAVTSNKVTDTISTLNVDFPAIIEEDQEVSIDF